jgi:hypothetical protein
MEILVYLVKGRSQYVILERDPFEPTASTDNTASWQKTEISNMCIQPTVPEPLVRTISGSKATMFREENIPSRSPGPELSESDTLGCIPAHPSVRSRICAVTRILHLESFYRVEVESPSPLFAPQTKVFEAPTIAFCHF